MPYVLKIVFWTAITLSMFFGWERWAPRLQARRIHALAVALAAGILAAIVCGVATRPAKLLVFMGIVLPTYFVFLLRIWPGFGRFPALADQLAAERRARKAKARR